MTQETSIREELRRTGRVVYKNRGRSMLPLLRQNRDLMIIETPKKPPERLDAVLYERPDGRLILHRILKSREDEYWIIGDNCVSGEAVPKEAVLGVLTGVKRGKRVIRTTDPGYRLYVRLWCAPYPLRILLQSSYRALRRCARRLRKAVKRKWKISE